MQFVIVLLAALALFLYLTLGAARDPKKKKFFYLYLLIDIWLGCILASGEAMACGVPFVVTNVGGLSALIVGDTGKVVPPRGPRAFANAWEDLNKTDKDAWLQLGNATRKRVEKNFNLPFIAGRYEKLYQEIGLSSFPNLGGR